MHGMINTQMSSISHSHRRKHSGELDVFEATRYFSAEADAHVTAAGRAVVGDRRSLDMPLDAEVPQPHPKVVELTSHNMVKDRVRCKQPSSPGGKLASFLSNLFQQYHSNSKKSKRSSSSSSKLVKGDHHQEESINRRKRSSMSSTIHHESRSCYYSSSCSSSSNTEFRTPLNSNSKKRVSEGFKDGINEVNIWGDDEFRLKMRLGDELNIKIKKDHEKLEVDDDGGESDASSDLFELKINNSYGFGEMNSNGSRDHVGVMRSRERFASTVAY